ncbi:HpcH/HpaI aldolase/citrate lyase family protein [Sabulicella rubraurantiaca]|uniref:HpcH/HpaI aldolase/citrate lyase family protein n=1 Tax=Sabulicella rubraurantiaca TaxID=2811429 RepID=UPI001A96E183|nr:CoA ester lyase [Sabulicella rubraurantiaca]
MTWRSLLYVPVVEERFVAKAAERGADAVILDCEDSIAPDRKEEARSTLASAVPCARPPGGDVLVRVNRPLAMAVADIEAAVAAGADGLVLTKVMGPEHVQLLAELANPGMKLIALVEEAKALPHLDAIARAHPALVALGIGGEDLATDLGAEATPDALDLPKRLGLIAARGAGILPLGFIGTVAGLSDPEGYRAMLRRSRALGFACATCVHPSQVAVINEEYGPCAEELDRARRMVLAFDAALAEGRGAVTFEGQMIDRPIVERAKALLRRA